MHSHTIDNAASAHAGGSTEGKIRCIFLSEFHATAGCKISCQVPDNYISKEVFDAINVYIIPKQHLQRCILTVNAMDVKIVGYPVGIQDQQKYARNAFLFNLCFVCDSRARSVQYEPVVKKLSEYLIMMEEESCFLSREDDKLRLQNIFQTVLRDLNERKVATIVEGDNTIYIHMRQISNNFPLLLFCPGPRTRNIIENQLFRRQRSLKLEALQRQRSQYGTIDATDDDEVDSFDKTYIVIIFTEKAKLRHCQDVEKIIQEFDIQTTLEIVSKTEKYLYLSASLNTLLRLADAAELEKMTTTGSIQKFNHGCVSDFLLPGMTKEQILTYCETPVLIKDVIEPQIRSYLQKGYIEDMFPLHDILFLDRFNLNLKRTTLPIEEIRNYFGSSIGLYFGFIEFYTKALVFPAAFGLLQCLWNLNLSLVCSFYVVWTTIFLELWKRKCAGYSYRWGTIEMSSLDKPRAAYKGQLKPDPITGKMTLSYPMRYTYLQMYCISYPVVLGCVVAAAWFALYQFQIEAEVLADFGADSWLLYIPVIVQSVLISIFSWAYEKLATFLTNLENHRTRSQYERHRVNKLILFEIVNNFFSQFYIAFVLQDLKQLKYQLMMQLLIFQLLCIAQEIGIPLMAVLRQKYAKYCHEELDPEKLRAISNKPRYEQSFYESGLDAYHSTYEDYLQVCIQFGYVVLFAAVAPFAAIGALINNIFAVHIDMFKLCNIFKRPFGRRAKNIGAWQLAFELLSVMSLLSNCGLLFLQPNVKQFFSHWIPSIPDLSFVIFEHVLLGLKFLIHKVIHERPRWVRIGLLKADFETSQALKQLKKFKAANKIA